MAELWQEIGKGVFVVRAPLRISFAGGGTDFASFYKKSSGAVLSAAIDKYVFITVKRHSPLFNEPIRLNYSETELVDSVDRIQNDIIRMCFQSLKIELPIYVSTVADLPSASGLGSSSTFTVGLLKALHAMKGEDVSAGQLAQEACKVEIDFLKKPIGKQDQFAASYGDLNFISFNADESVPVSAVKITQAEKNEIFSFIMLFWTGLVRQSESVLEEQKRNTEDKTNEEYLLLIRDQAIELNEMLTEGGFDPYAMGHLLDKGWRYKRKLASKVSSPEIDSYYEIGKAAGAIGGKLCGAGGGGFLMFIVEPKKQNRVKQALSDLKFVPVGFDAAGVKLLFPNH